MSGIDIFTKEYLGKVFYFCLKKTGSEQDAAELAGDIGLEVLQAFARGKKPENFDAWLWTVARNRWAKWAAKKYYHPEQLDIGEYEEVLASEESIEEDMVRSEELMRIRRELAFIRADYRQILVAHYFEERSVSEISRQFGIPVGTVKTKLQSSRKILKEGMNMSRQFGTRSFQPETIYFTASGNQPSGLPWKAVERKIPVNILCEANNNPCTVEELSMELGIAMPYMEEEVALLEEAELLRRLDNGKYITSFFISPKECQSEVNELSCRFAERHYRGIWELAGRVEEKFREAGAFSGAVSPMDAQAFFAFLIERQLLENALLPAGLFFKFKRKDGGSWGFMGREKGASCRLPQMFVDNQWYMGESAELAPMFLTWCLYSCNSPEYGKSLYRESTPSGDVQMITLKRVALGDDVADFSDSERCSLEELLDKGFCVKAEDGRVQVAALVYRNEIVGEIKEYLAELPEYGQLKAEMRSYREGVREIITKYSVPCVEEELDFYVGMSMNLSAVFSKLWKDRGLYTGGNAQFAAFSYTCP